MAKRVGVAVVGFLLLAAALGLALTLQLLTPSNRGAAALESTRLFEFTRVFPVHLVFTPEQWTAMEPQGGFGPFGSNPFGPPGPPGDASIPGDRGGPGFPGRPGPGQFGPSMFLAPLFLRGDSDGDGRLSSIEFSGLGPAWFLAWDTNNSGAVDLDQVRAGLNAAMPGPGDFGPGGGPRGNPAGAGGPGFGGARGGPGGPGGGPDNMLLGAEGKRNGLASAMGLEFPSARADLEFAGAQFPTVSVRYKGNGTFMSSRDTLKRSMKIDLNDLRPVAISAGRPS